MQKSASHFRYIQGRDINGNLDYKVDQPTPWASVSSPSERLLEQLVCSNANTEINIAARNVQDQLTQLEAARAANNQLLLNSKPSKNGY